MKIINYILYVLIVIQFYSCKSMKPSTKVTTTTETTVKSKTESNSEAEASFTKPASKDAIDIDIADGQQKEVTLGNEKITMKRDKDKISYSREKPADTLGIRLKLKSELQNEINTKTETSTTLEQTKGWFKAIGDFLNSIIWIIILLILGYVFIKTRK